MLHGVCRVCRVCVCVCVRACVCVRTCVRAQARAGSAYVRRVRAGSAGHVRACVRAFVLACVGLCVRVYICMDISGHVRACACGPCSCVRRLWVRMYTLYNMCGHLWHTSPNLIMLPEDSTVPGTHAATLCSRPVTLLPSRPATRRIIRQVQAQVRLVTSLTL